MSSFLGFCWILISISDIPPPSGDSLAVRVAPLDFILNLGTIGAGGGGGGGAGGGGPETAGAGGSTVGTLFFDITKLYSSVISFSNGCIFSKILSRSSVDKFSLQISHKS